jgi:hypothetical protein
MSNTVVSSSRDGSRDAGGQEHEDDGEDWTPTSHELSVAAPRVSAPGGGAETPRQNRLATG